MVTHHDSIMRSSKTSNLTARGINKGGGLDKWHRGEKYLFLL